MFSKTAVSVVSVAVMGALLAIGGQAIASTTKPATSENSRVAKERAAAKTTNNSQTAKERAAASP
jgi:ABC-type Fe2+-enterobactin transport system substrate-binding protein